MKLLSDTRGNWPDRSTAWTRAPVDRLPEAERAAWRALSPADSAWTADVPGTLPLLILIAAAPVSQMTAVDDALRAGDSLPGRFAAIALEGHDFKGQRERSWQALKGNIHLTMSACLHLPVGRAGAGLVALPAVACCEAVRRVTGGAADPAIKWVNDVLLGEGKIAGVLTRTRTRGATIEEVVFGIGLNVEAVPALEPVPFVPPPARLGHDVSCHEMLPPLLDALDRRLDDLLKEGPGPIIDAYRERSAVVGRTVRIWPEGTADLAGTDPVAEGRVLAITDDLALRLDGCPAPIHTGRLALIDGSLSGSPGFG